MYSNCLIEALKAKVKNPKGVEIHVLSPTLNNGHLHFYWIEDELVCQFTHKHPVALPIFFNGRIKRHSMNIYEGKMFQKMKELGWSHDKQVAYATKKGFLNKEPFDLTLDKD